MIARRGPVGKGRATARVNDKVAAECELTFALTTMPAPAAPARPETRDGAHDGARSAAGASAGGPAPGRLAADGARPRDPHLALVRYGSRPRVRSAHRADPPRSPGRCAAGNADGERPSACLPGRPGRLAGRAVVGRDRPGRWRPRRRPDARLPRLHPPSQSVDCRSVRRPGARGGPPARPAVRRGADPAARPLVGRDAGGAGRHPAPVRLLGPRVPAVPDGHAAATQRARRREQPGARPSRGSATRRRRDRRIADPVPPIPGLSRGCRLGRGLGRQDGRPRCAARGDPPGHRRAGQELAAGPLVGRSPGPSPRPTTPASC